MKRLKNMSIFYKTYLLVCFLVITFVVTFAFCMSTIYYKKAKDTRTVQIYSVAELLAKELNGSFADIINQENAQDKNLEDKVRLINNELQPIIDKISSINPNLGMGYYARELDSIVAIGPEKDDSLLKKVSRDYPYFKSYQSGVPEYSFSGKSIGWYGKSIYNVTHPIFRNGEIIGHTWANVKMDDIINEAKEQTKKLFLFSSVFLGMLLLVMKLVFCYLKKQISDITDKIINDAPIEVNLLPEVELLIKKMKKHREYEEEIVKLDKLSIVGEMAATIAHEIRNPLTTIKGFLQLKKSKSTAPEDLKHFSLMIDELDRANSIITEYLTLANNSESSFKRVDLNNIVKSIFPLIQSDAIKENKTAVLELDDIPKILLNSKEIKQLIINLSRNGLEAMEENGYLTISTYKTPNEVVLAIADEGHGIDPIILEKVGTPFLTTKPHGNGLGLAVCKRIVAKHNANIDIQTSSAGTIFYIKFKLKQD